MRRFVDCEHDVVFLCDLLEAGFAALQKAVTGGDPKSARRLQKCFRFKVGIAEV